MVCESVSEETFETDGTDEICGAGGIEGAVDTNDGGETDEDWEVSEVDESAEDEASTGGPGFADVITGSDICESLYWELPV